MKGALNRLRENLRFVTADEIARRYLVLNAFDGALATLGIITGAYFAGASRARVMLIAGLGVSLAMGISGAWGAYLTEGAERKRAIRELEEALFTSLGGSTLEASSRAAVILIALVDGLSPVFTSLICLLPLLISSLGVIALETAVVISAAVTLAILFSLGTFVARISDSNLIIQGVLMASAGFIVIAFVYLLGVS